MRKTLISFFGPGIVLTKDNATVPKKSMVKFEKNDVIINSSELSSSFEMTQQQQQK